jgi:2-phospho-L-lactate guanylyltransferase (CobY/MobA/RfbA family)
LATIVIPFRPGGKTRLGDPAVAEAMLLDVRSACEQVGDVRICDAPGGQGAAVAAELASVRGPVAVVNADVPCVTPDEVRELLAAAPALVAARDGTTNALALTDPDAFRPLYGEGSAARFGLLQLDLPGLREDVDTWDDLRRLAADVGPNTRRVLHVHA